MGSTRLYGTQIGPLGPLQSTIYCHSTHGAYSRPSSIALLSQPLNNSSSLCVPEKKRMCYYVWMMAAAWESSAKAFLWRRESLWRFPLMGFISIDTEEGNHNCIEIRINFRHLPPGHKGRWASRRTFFFLCFYSSRHFFFSPRRENLLICIYKCGDCRLLLFKKGRRRNIYPTALEC